MKTLLIVLLPLFAAQSAFAQNNYQDVIYLIDGTVIRGHIIEHIPSESVTIQTSEGNVFIYSLDAVSKITKNPDSRTNRTQKYWKYPGTSCMLSGLFPGLGQFYNEEPDKGVLLLGGAITGCFIFWRELYEFDIFSDDYELEVGFFIWATCALISIIDAPISSARINREKEEKERRRNTRNATRRALQAHIRYVNLNPIVTENAKGVMVSWRF